MFIYALLSITFGLALLSLFLLYISAIKPLRAGWSRMLTAFCLGVFIYLYGTWIYLTIDAKFGFGICLLLCLGIALMRKKRTVASPAGWKIGLNLFFAALLSVLSVLYFTGTTGPSKDIELSFPLKTGKYFVLQGGKGLPTNLFHYSLRGAIYAMDIVKLKPNGSRANKIFSKVLKDYEIFGDTLYAPCNGVVARAYSDNPDNIPPDMTRGPNNTNQVLIETDTSYVFMAHLKMGSVIVKEGDTVRQGQPVGCVGNSGFSSEPHLHIQAHEKIPGVPWYKAPPLYIHFNGKGYLLYEVIRPGRVHMVN
jgi:hypothetical protein